MANNTGDPILMDKPINGVYKYIHLDTDVGKIQATTKPTHASLGAYQGWSLPVYNTDDEELFSCTCIPMDWDGTSAFTMLLGGWLDTANDTKKFQLQLSHAHAAANATLSDAVADVPIETDTGNAAQYKFFILQFTIAVGTYTAGEAIAIRVRRIAATSVEIAGEFVVMGVNLRYVSNYIGEPV